MNNTNTIEKIIDSAKDEKRRDSSVINSAIKESITLTGSKEFSTLMTSYYVISKNMFELASKYANTLAYWRDKASNASTDKETIEASTKALQTYAYYSHLKKVESAKRKTFFKMINDSLYKSYCNRFAKPSVFENAIKVWLEKYGLATYSGVIEFIVSAVGCRNASIKKLCDDVTIENLTKKQFSELYFNTLLQIALCKDCISNKVLKREIKALLEIDVNECETPIYERFNGKETKTELKKRLSACGFDCNAYIQKNKGVKTISKWKLSDYQTAYQVAFKKGYYLEY